MQWIMFFFQLELRLAEKEERLLEKDLIFDQVERLVSRISNKAQAGKDDTLNLAKSVSISLLKILVLKSYVKLFRLICMFI